MAFAHLWGAKTNSTDTDRQAFFKLYVTNAGGTEVETLYATTTILDTACKLTVDHIGEHTGSHDVVVDNNLLMSTNMKHKYRDADTYDYCSATGYMDRYSLTEHRFYVTGCASDSPLVIAGGGSPASLILRYDGSSDWLFKCGGTEVFRLDPLNLTMATTNKLKFRDADTYIQSYSAGNLKYHAVGTHGFYSGNCGSGSSLRISIGETGVIITGPFSCNNATPQTAYASGGAVSPGAGAYGASSAANFAALATLVANIRTALVANGIMT
jgi:hypothetical protein